MNSHFTSSSYSITAEMNTTPECPFANLQDRINVPEQAKQCPYHAHTVPAEYEVQQPVMLHVKGGTHYVSEATASLLHDIGGGDRIREFVTRFYARAFLDVHIKEFFFAHDGPTAHAKRLADWIIQKMGGEGEPWTDSGRLGMRQPSHRAAWNCEKRDPSRIGQHFKLDDCRIWMRLHFWAARECGLHEHSAFWDWYIEFIEHFIAVYERSAPRYTAEDAEWSASVANLQAYEQQGLLMSDVVGRW